MRTTLPATVSPEDQTNLTGKSGEYARTPDGAIQAGKATDVPVFAIYYPDYSCTKFLTTAKSVKYDKSP
ncbi:hypothetical protein C6P11_02905 [Weissella confusa]|uniref:Uncharacterized protein n=1 Tax=Weissella confusa TaxID=1583 RepID=A0A4Z0S5W5_WEICO|nr:hypothetical protein C6P11_02905 [Weissella confusa]